MEALSKIYKRIWLGSHKDHQTCTLAMLVTTSVVVILLCFAYLDIRAIPVVPLIQPSDARLMAFAANSSEPFGLRFFKKTDRRIQISRPLSSCNFFDGSWVFDDSYPLYESSNCPFIDPGFRCQENGRPDKLYMKWRWQPSACSLPRFNALNMLRMLQNRRIAFVGDSIGRNQWESLLCMVAQAVPDKPRIYEANGNPISNHRGFLSFKFEDFNCSVEYYRAPFLVLQSRPPKGSPPQVKSTLKLDLMDWDSVHWKDADILVFNTGHWWNFEKTLRGGCYFQEGEHINMSMDVPTAFERSMKTVVKWIQQEINTQKTHVFFRSYAPVHFRGGNWKTGGQCHRETRPATNTHGFDDPSLARTNTIVSKTLQPLHGKQLHIMNISMLTQLRKDGHSSLYYLGNGLGPASIRRQDCSHWCLPGVPDAWNEILYGILVAWGYSNGDNKEILQ